MKRQLFFVLLILAVTGNVANSQVLVFPYDAAVVSIDGTITANEWQNAATAKIPVSGTDTVIVLYKHDQNALHFAFMGKLESANALFPEVLMDPHNQRTSNWINGQWWFHVSATDCENNGAYGVYNNCLGTQPGWTAGPNIAMGAPYTDTMEITIPLTKIGYSAATDDTIGIALLVTNTMTIYKMFPITADRNSPVTWAKAILGNTTTSIPNVEGKRGTSLIAPNPAKDHLSLESTEEAAYEIYDLNGKVLSTGLAQSGKTLIDVAGFPPAVYTLKLTFKDSTTETIKFCKQ
jgi:hypothetical protein